MTKTPTEAAWLSYNDAATHTGLSRKTLERAVAAGSIPYVRDPMTGRVRFRRDELDAWMRGTAKRGRRAG